jgi:catechol 2,3-dioxygenase-like lactoylglutathione lyase family enzyme
MPNSAEAGTKKEGKIRSTMRTTGVLESCLYATDLTAVEQFYTDVIGLELISREQGRHVFFRCGESVVLIFNPEHTSTQQTQVGDAKIPLHGARGAGHLAFRIAEEELPGWRQHLDKNDVEIESEVSWPNGAQSIYFRDPAGNSIELVSPRLWGLG